METTTIQISRDLRKTLEGMKLHPRETCSDVLERLLEDLKELNEETKREIEEAIREIEAGKSKTQEEVESELGL
jgi:predicted transcriptional regulator